MKTVIFGIGHLKKLYWNDINIVFFDEFGWWIKDERDDERKLVDIYSFDIQLKGLSREDTRNIVPELMEWAPIWSRWVGRGDQYELLVREAYIQILYISAGLKKLNIKHAIFQTSVSHHIPTIIFEKACTHSYIRPIFLYNEVITGRCILLQHNNDVSNRKVLDYKISDFKSEKLVDAFFDNKLSNQQPKNNVLLNKKNKNLFFGISYLIIRTNISKLKQFFLNKSNSESNRKIFFQMYPFQEYFQMIQQYKAMNFYNNIVSNNREINKNIVKPKLLIAAHFQPEATSFPEGWGMSNHIDMVIELKRLGYEDDIIYKEHTASFAFTAPIVGTTRVGMYRSVSYFEQLLKLGCKFMDSNSKLSLDMNENNWYLPVTITGTIALERSLAGLHTIVMGHPWYKGLPGVIHINDIKSLDNIRKEWVTPNQEIREKSKVFINNLLNNHTLLNIKHNKISKEDLIVLKYEFDALLLNLDNESN